MRAFKMTGYNSDNVKRVRYRFAKDFKDAEQRFTKEFWYLHIESITECPASEASINGVHN
ncbi:MULTISPECIES: hypothetical protein [Desulfococcus]|uniref:Uncharacterized protein n=1 Tax=Desulfococcus multivorans DSM 2059 TaxID=1121405 RepID=S7VEJ3_DESML|nr:hypothetical protein [Desulfococcus multivorans]AQV01643.1 hypothetical protein B2D07_13310 [Desulfococcus multivorans]EPR42858.1 hypothetical protein dsmv_1509 [Desulfococcus multivorans DSM 2059]MDX9817686.1 hypothetical protein [Desulfococcus multivorans]SKA00769.1 hypothetical protein SAMN02745446_02390 [Desulfococcus multivorans DSM 2059]